jgi:hypothetical protein
MASKKAPTSMNRSLLSLYGGKTPEPGMAAPPVPEDGGAERPAFAPPHVIAAAAARAAREAAAMESGGGRGLPATPAAPTSSTQQQRQQQEEEEGGEEAGVVGTASQRAMPASSSGRPPADAPATSTKAGTQTAAKGKRGGLTPAERWAGVAPLVGMFCLCSFPCRQALHYMCCHCAAFHIG